MDPTFEHVLRVDDWYDGVREGIALYRGVPHYFVWLGWECDGWDPDDDRYRLSPLDPARGEPRIVRGEFRNSATAPHPQCPPMLPQEVRWSPLADAVSR